MEFLEQVVEVLLEHSMIGPHIYCWRTVAKDRIDPLAGWGEFSRWGRSLRGTIIGSKSPVGRGPASYGTRFLHCVIVLIHLVEVPVAPRHQSLD